MKKYFSWEIPRIFFSAFALRIDLRIALSVFSLLLICGVWLSADQTLETSKANIVADARRDAQSLARLFLEHANRTIEAADQAAMYLRYRYAERGTSLDMEAEIENGLVPRNIYNLFTIVDRNGNVILSSKPFSPMNLSDREHIHVHMVGSNDELYISKPLLGRVSQRWSLQLTRRINQPDGSFGGVVVVSMDPQYFTRLYHQIDVGQYGAISLAGEDGIIRVRRVGTTDAMGENIASGKLFAEMRAKSNGIIETSSSLDGRFRIYAFQKLPRYPLYAVVGIDLEERLEKFYEERTRTLVLAALLTLGIVIFNVSMLWLASALLKSRRAALAASETKSRFLSNMSHELRTPLNGILGYSDALRDELKGNPAEEFATIIHQSGTRLLTTINTILDLTALEDHRVALNLSRENLRELVLQAIGRHSRDAYEKGLQLECNIAQDVPNFIDCDASKMLRVLDNLISNAVRFTTKGRVNLLVGCTADGALEIHVQDTGIGIPAEEHERIFEKFSQLDDSPHRTNDGTGLGLTIAKRLTVLMGGNIRVESAPDCGTTVTFTLPRDRLHVTA